MSVPGLYDADEMKTAGAKLVDRVHNGAYKDHMAVGIIGVKFLYPVLASLGQHDLAVQMLTQPDYPSHHYMFNNPYENATGMWELLDAPAEGPGMNSRNHHMYTSVSGFIVNQLGGLSVSGNEIHARVPSTLATLQWAETEIADASFKWRLSDAKTVAVEVGVPVGKFATLHPPHWMRVSRIVNQDSGELVWDSATKLARLGPGIRSASLGEVKLGHGIHNLLLQG